MSYLYWPTKENKSVIIIERVVNEKNSSICIIGLYYVTRKKKETGARQPEKENIKRNTHTKDGRDSRFGFLDHGFWKRSRTHHERREKHMEI
jgi:hypothetical protein